MPILVTRNNPKKHLGRGIFNFTRQHVKKNQSFGIKPRSREPVMKKDIFLNNPCTESGNWEEFLNLHWN